jgi:hypothetical protein
VGLNNAIGEMTIMNQGCGKANSWYRGANIPGKPAGAVMPWPAGALLYRQKVAECEAEGYAGFEALAGTHPLRAAMLLCAYALLG